MKRLAASCWGHTGDVGTWHQLLQSVGSFPSSHWVRAACRLAVKLQAAPARDQEALGLDRDIRSLEGPCWYLGGFMSVGYLWDKCMSAACAQQAPNWTSCQIMDVKDG